jgi:lysozyme family protein
MHEGGYSNHPSDPGGPTNFGITIADYRAYIKPGANAADVKAMTADEARAIYRAKYWDAQRCDELNAGVDYAVFDYGVNSGIGRSGKVLRRVLGLSDSTSAVTNDVVKAARARDAGELITAICDERMRFLRALKTWPVFGVGWGRRVAEVRAAALAMCVGAASVEVATKAAGRGVVPIERGAQKTTAGGVATAGAAAAQQAHQQGADPKIIIAIIATTAALTLGAWLFWRWRQRSKQEAPASAKLETAT